MGKTYVTPLVTKGVRLGVSPRGATSLPRRGFPPASAKVLQLLARSRAIEGNRGPPPGKSAHRGLSQIHDHADYRPQSYVPGVSVRKMLSVFRNFWRIIILDVPL